MTVEDTFIQWMISHSSLTLDEIENAKNYLSYDIHLYRNAILLACYNKWSAAATKCIETLTSNDYSIDQCELDRLKIALVRNELEVITHVFHGTYDELTKSNI